MARNISQLLLYFFVPEEEGNVKKNHQSVLVLKFDCLNQKLTFIHCALAAPSKQTCFYIEKKFALENCPFF